MDKKKPIYMVLVGAVASGKFTYAKQCADECNVKVFSSDEYRKNMYGSEADQSHNDKVFAALYRDLRAALEAGEDCILDATNCTIKSRLKALDAVKGIDCVKIASILTTDAEQCLKRNSKRERKVPEEVVYKYIRSFEIPLPWEGWDRIYIQGYDTDFSPKHNQKMEDIALKQMEGYVQRTPHHQYTLRKHAQEVANQFPDNRVLHSAALFHDIGKALAPWDWTEKPEEGVRHYYNHAHISAHIMLQNLECFDCKSWEETYETMFLICYHMVAREWRADVALYDKWEARVGEKWMDDMMKFIRADEIGSGNGDYAYHAEIRAKIKAGYYIDHQDELIPEDYVEPKEKEDVAKEVVTETSQGEELTQNPPKTPPFGGMGMNPMAAMLGGMMGGFGGMGGMMPPMSSQPVVEEPKEESADGSNNDNGAV